MPSVQEQPSAATTLPRRRLFLGYAWVKERIKRGAALLAAADRRRWLERAALSRRVHTHYWWIVVGLVVLGIGEQALLYSRANPVTNGGPINIFPNRFILPALFLYVAVALRLLRNRTAAALSQLKPVVKIDAPAFDAHVQRTLRLNRWHLFVILCASLALNLYLFAIEKAYLPLSMTQTLPTDWPAAFLVLGTFVLFGCLLMTLVYLCVHFALALNRLSHYKLAINVLDPYALLPFGELALLYSLTLVVFILFLIIPLGLPEAFSDYFVVFLASLGSLWALIGPIWGVHRQIQRAKDDVLERIHDQFAEIQAILLDGTRFEKAELDDLSSRADKLVKLRALIWDAPNWPFRTSTGVLRAVLAALTPLLLVILQVIVQNVTAYLIARTRVP